MTKLIDLSGKRFGRLVVICRDESKRIRVYWKCKCDCGNIVSVCGCRLSSGETKSCGCLRKEKLSAMAKKHGFRKTTLYSCWINMKTRCDNPNFIEYDRYGGRGISYCKEWKSFENFMNWSLQNGFKELKDKKGRNLLSLDRKNNNGNYEPSNCKWSTRIEQARNKNTNANYVYKGNIYCLSALAELSTVTVDTLRRRIRSGWSVENAVDTQSKTCKRRKLYGTK